MLSKYSIHLAVKYVIRSQKSKKQEKIPDVKEKYTSRVLKEKIMCFYKRYEKEFGF